MSQDTETVLWVDDEPQSGIEHWEITERIESAEAHFTIELATAVPSWVWDGEVHRFAWRVREEWSELLVALMRVSRWSVTVFGTVVSAEGTGRPMWISLGG